MPCARISALQQFSPLLGFVGFVPVGASGPSTTYELKVGLFALTLYPRLQLTTSGACESRQDCSVHGCQHVLTLINWREHHSDQREAEGAEALSNFHFIVHDWNHNACKSSVPKAEAGNGEEKAQPQKAGRLVTTDASLPAAALGEPSLGARVLIHFDLPTKKESYLRRMAACLASAPTVVGTTSFGGIADLGRIAPGYAVCVYLDHMGHVRIVVKHLNLWTGIVICVVVGGEVGLLRSIVSSSPTL